MTRRGSIAAVAGAVAMALSAGAMALTPGTASAQRLVGLNLNFLAPDSAPTARAHGFQLIRSAGVSGARIDANWSQVERRPGVYDWSSLDHQVAELRAHGLAPLVILDYGNPLYSRAGAAAAATGFGGVPPFGIGAPAYYPPDSPAPFARFAAALARRYRGDVSRFEVWNEENLGWRFWEPHEDPAGYAALLKATYLAVKAVAPEDRVAFGGTFYPAVDAGSAAADGIPVPAGGAAGDLALPHQGTLEFLAHALAAMPDLGRYFDAVAYHPYHFPYMGPEVDIPVEGTTEGSMVAVRRLLATRGLGAKPIWITEVGWPNNTAAYGATSMKTASYLVRTFTTAWAHGIDTVFWYCFGDASDWQYNQESAFGIVDYRGRPKPAYYAWRTLDRLLLGVPYLSRVAWRLPADGRALRFGSGRRQAIVAWLAPETMYSDQGAEPPADQRVTVATPAGTREILDMLGHRLPVGRTLEVSPYPVYVVLTARRRGSGSVHHTRRPARRHRRSRPLPPDRV